MPLFPSREHESRVGLGAVHTFLSLNRGRKVNSIGVFF